MKHDPDEKPMNSHARRQIAESHMVEDGGVAQRTEHTSTEQLHVECRMCWSSFDGVIDSNWRCCCGNTWISDGKISGQFMNTGLTTTEAAMQKPRTGFQETGESRGIASARIPEINEECWVVVDGTVWHGSACRTGQATCELLTEPVSDRQRHTDCGEMKWLRARIKELETYANEMRKRAEIPDSEQQTIDDLDSAVESVEQERDEAQADAARCRGGQDKLQKQIATLIRERDARGHLLDRLQKSMGAGWWTGAVETAEALRAQLATAEAKLVKMRGTLEKISERSGLGWPGVDAREALADSKDSKCPDTGS